MALWRSPLQEQLRLRQPGEPEGFHGDHFHPEGKGIRTGRFPIGGQPTDQYDQEGGNHDYAANRVDHVADLLVSTLLLIDLKFLQISAVVLLQTTCFQFIFQRFISFGFFQYYINYKQRN